jgi:hypothetical protein
VPTYGNAGSTFIDELNRLANGGASYPAITTYKDEASAARAWASARSVTLTGGITDTVGVLNQIASNIRPDWKDLAGVCNQIASTTGLDPVAALREVAS